MKRAVHAAGKNNERKVREAVNILERRTPRPEYPRTDPSQRKSEKAVNILERIAAAGISSNGSEPEKKGIERDVHSIVLV